MACMEPDSERAGVGRGQFLLEAEQEVALKAVKRKTQLLVGAAVGATCVIFIGVALIAFLDGAGTDGVVLCNV